MSNDCIKPQDQQEPLKQTIVFVLVSQKERLTTEWSKLKQQKLKNPKY